jgi:hypothetical protein
MRYLQWAFLLATLACPITLRTATAVQPGDDYPPRIADPSSWNFTRTHPGGAVQRGAFRIEDGLIYHLDAPQVVGRVWQDDLGRLHLEFRGHRKMVWAEAVVEKVRNGRWTGILDYADQEWEFDMRRR